MNIPNYEKCVKYALQMKGIESDHFVDTDLRVYERSTANPQTLPALLKKDGIVIPEVKVSLFNKVLPGTTATVVISADEATGTVELFNPITRVIRPFLLEEFVKAWVDAGGACTTAFPRDSKTYNPKLIDLKHVTLPDSLTKIEWSAFKGCTALESIILMPFAINIRAYFENDDFEYNEFKCMLDTKEYATKFSHEIKYDAVTQIFLNTAQSEAQAYIKKNFSKIIRYWIDKNDYPKVKGLVQSGAFITKRNIGGIIDYAIQNTQKGGNMEIQVMLMNYKNENFG